MTEPLKISRDALKQLLLEHECIVEFTKVNGEKRVMPCTLNPDLLPPKPEKKEGEEVEKATVKKENLTTLGVWCTDKKAWRSFRMDNITNVSIKED